MIKLINEELMNIITEEKENKNGEKYIEVLFKIAVETKNSKTGEVKQHVITKLFAESEDYNSEKTGINLSTTQYGTRVGLRSSDARVKNDTTIYIVAIPFNGYIKPIERQFDYRIYKSMVVTSDKRNIEFSGEMFKKIAYLIIVPNEKLFDETHKYHKDVIEFVMESYNLETVGEDQKDTVHSTTTIKFTKEADAEYIVATETVEPINPEDFKGQFTFPLYRPENKKVAESAKDNDKTVDIGNQTQHPTNDSLDDMIEKLNKKYSVEGHSDRGKKSRKKGKGKNRR